MRKQAALFVVWMVAAAAFVVLGPSPAPGAPVGTVLGEADFSGYAHGTNLHADALTVGAAPGPSIADAEAAFSGAAVDSMGFDATGVHNEEDIAVVPTPGAADVLVDSAGKETYGKGSGLEVGLATNLPNDDLNQIVLGGRAEAGAEPPERSDADPIASETDTGLVQTDLLEVPGSPLIYAQALLGEARAQWSTTNCILGEGADGFLSYGRGQAAKAQLIDASADDSTDDLDAPLVDASSDFFGTPGRAVADTQSFSYLVRNANDGTFGLATETHMTFAPIALLRTDPLNPAPIVIEILGEWVFRAVATGQPGGATIQYEVLGVSESPDTPVIRIYLGPGGPDDPPTIEIKRGDLFGETGIHVPALPIADLIIGEDPRAISAPNVDPDPTSSPTEAANGTLASGAADLIRLKLLDADPLTAGPQAVDLRVGHLEARAEVPAGGINCPGSVVINKDAPDDAQNVNFQFTVDCDDDGDSAPDPGRSRSITGDGSARIDLIPSGSVCTVTEVPEPGFVEQPPQRAPSEPPVGSTVETNGVHQVTFTNQRLPGSLTITKDAPDDAQGVTFDFTVSCDGDTTPDAGRSRSITGDGTSTSIDGIPAGSQCVVQEVTEPGFRSQPAQTATIVSQQTANVVFVNERAVDDDGSIVIVKDAPDNAQENTFDFNIVCPGATFARSITGDGSSEPVAGIPDGTECTVQEVTATGFEPRPDQVVTVEGSETVTVTFVNTRLGGGPPPDEGEPTVLVGGTVAGADVSGDQAARPGTAVRGVQVTRPTSPAATPVQAQPRFTG